MNIEQYKKSSERVHLLRKIDFRDFIAKVLLSTGLLFLVGSGLLGIFADYLTPTSDYNPTINIIQISFLSFALFLDSLGLMLYINILFLRKKVKKFDFEQMENEYMQTLKSLDSDKKEIWTDKPKKTTNKKKK